MNACDFLRFRYIIGLGDRHLDNILLDFGSGEVVHIDYSLPGCPPSADAFWQFLTDLMAGRTPRLGHGLMHYD